MKKNKQNKQRMFYWQVSKKNGKIFICKLIEIKHEE